MGKKETTNDKKYYIPLEITPETIITEEHKNSEICWTKICRRRVRAIMIPATKEQYLAYMRPLWREDKRELRHSADEKSTDQLYDDYEWETPDDFNLEKAILNKELLSVLYSQLELLKDIDRMILSMVANGFSEAAIGKKVGLSQKGVNKRKHKMYALLKEHLKDFR